MNAKRLRTTGEIRQFLCDTIIAVKDGDMNLDIARTVSKLAAQVTESLYSETKIMQFQQEANLQVGALGELNISVDKKQ